MNWLDDVLLFVTLFLNLSTLCIVPLSFVMAIDWAVTSVLLLLPVAGPHPAR